MVHPDFVPQDCCQSSLECARHIAFSQRYWLVGSLGFKHRYEALLGKKIQALDMGQGWGVPRKATGGGIHHRLWMPHCHQE